MQNRDDHTPVPHEAIQGMTPEAFAMLGAPHLAYVSPIETQQGTGFGVYAANGNLLAVARSRELAFATARQNELEALSVH